MVVWHDGCADATDSAVKQFIWKSGTTAAGPVACSTTSDGHDHSNKDPLSTFSSGGMDSWVRQQWWHVLPRVTMLQQWYKQPITTPKVPYRQRAETNPRLETLNDEVLDVSLHDTTSGHP